MSCDPTLFHWLTGTKVPANRPFFDAAPDRITTNTLASMPARTHLKGMPQEVPWASTSYKAGTSGCAARMLKIVEPGTMHADLLVETQLPCVVMGSMPSAVAPLLENLYGVLVRANQSRPEA